MTSKNTTCHPKLWRDCSSSSSWNEDGNDSSPMTHHPLMDNNNSSNATIAHHKSFLQFRKQIQKHGWGMYLHHDSIFTCPTIHSSSSFTQHETVFHLCMISMVFTQQVVIGIFIFILSSVILQIQQMNTECHVPYDKNSHMSTRSLYPSIPSSPPLEFVIFFALTLILISLYSMILSTTTAATTTTTQHLQSQQQQEEMDPISKSSKSHHHHSSSSPYSSFYLYWTHKISTRMWDLVLLALILRWMFPILRTLTFTYSSDTVYALAVVCMILHVLTCNYSYFLGKNYLSSSSSLVYPEEDSTKIYVETRTISRPLFHGGTLSLNFAFVSILLLVSRFFHSVTPSTTSSSTTTTTTTIVPSSLSSRILQTWNDVSSFFSYLVQHDDSTSWNECKYGFHEESSQLLSFGFLLVAILLFALYPHRRHYVSFTIQQELYKIQKHLYTASNQQQQLQQQDKGSPKWMYYYYWSIQSMLYPLLITITLSCAIVPCIPSIQGKYIFYILCVWTSIIAPLVTYGYIQMKPPTIQGPWDIPTNIMD